MSKSWHDGADRRSHTRVWKKKKVRLNVIGPRESYSHGSEERKRRCGLLFDSEEATTCEATAKGYCQVGEDRGTREQTLENSCESSKQAKSFLSAVAQILTHKLSADTRNCPLNYFVINQRFSCFFPIIVNYLSALQTQISL